MFFSTGFKTKCKDAHVIFVFDELQPDSRTFFTNNDFARYLVQGMDGSAAVTLLTIITSKSKSTNPKPNFSVIFNSTKKAELTSDMWLRRTESTWTMQDLVHVCNEKKSRVVLIGVNLRRSSFFESLFRDLQFNEMSKTRLNRRASNLKTYNISYNIAHQNREKKAGHMTKRINNVAAKDRLVQHTVTRYENAEQFQNSYTFLKNDVCHFPRISSVKYITNGLCTTTYNNCPGYFEQRQTGIALSSRIPSVKYVTNGLCSATYNNCPGYFEQRQNEIALSLEIDEYSWKSFLFLKPHHEAKERAIEHLDWGSSMIICSEHGMTPFMVRNKREAKFFSQLIVKYLPNFYNGHGMDRNLDIDEINMMIGLKRSKATIGRRFSWGEHKDLLYSHWGPGQPRDTSIKECVYWKFKRNGGRLWFVDQGWFTFSCGKKSASVLSCNQNVLPSNHPPLLRTFQEEKHLPDVLERGAFSTIKEGEAGGTIIVGMLSLTTLTSGVSTEKIGENPLNISRMILGESGIMSRNEIELLFKHLHSLYFPCRSKGTYSPFVSRVIPFSQVCNGAIDCPTGEDEDSCSSFNDVSCSPTPFSCKSGQCVPLEAKCDLIKDCQDGSDEEDCELDCPHRQCPSGRCLPKSWFSDGQEDCDDGFDEGSNGSSIDTCVFICNRSKCITRAMLNDSVVDCQGPEGHLDETLGALESMNCSQTGEMTFKNNWAPKCVLVRDNFGELIGCRDFQHLADCSNFSCPINFVKCPESFCIPLSYVGDGKQDCDYGEDEEERSMLSIKNFFLCNFGSEQRVPLSAICDGKKDCALGQDELECGIQCSPGFICLPGAIMAYNISEILTPQLLSFMDTQTRYLDLSTVSIPEFFHIYPRGRLHYILTLNLSKCDISTISINKSATSSKNYNSLYNERLGYKDFSMIQNVDLSHNGLTEIQGRSHFNKMHHLRTLDLSHNFQLRYISQDSFIGLKNLEILDLSFTRISFLGKRTFEVLINLRNLSLKSTGLTAINFVFPQSVRYLNFEGTKVSDISQDAFSNVRSLRELLSPTYKLCCPVVLGAHIQSHACHFSGDFIHSCDDLIEEPGLRTLLWIGCCATLVGNIITLVYRLTWDRAIVCKPYGLFVTNLGISDLMMGIYLMIITVADATFKDMYVLHDYRWRHSHTCSIAGVVGTLSSITSTVFIALITVDRFLAVQYPYGEVRFTVRTMVAAVMITWVCGAVAASLPLMPFAQDWVIFSNSGMCLGLPFNEKRPPGWQYSAVMFVAVNLLLFIFIGIGQYRIFKKIREKRKRTKKHVNRSNRLSQNQRLQEIAVAKQLSLIVMTNFFCWFPIITMGIVALSGHDLDQVAYSLSATLILPINSALNPVLYTLPALKKKLDDVRALKREVHKTREIRASLKLTRQDSSLGKKPYTRRMLLFKSYRSVRALRQVLLLTNKRGTFAESDLMILYSKVYQHLVAYRRC
ncbi:relaxin receptor-like protein [Plakobranchus ocellatus]|uniref:Relaxin receptor-like protein n=1 Tax=Plakobranchus ocellatus TaxID=259542 RepID=A0AAV3ZWE9_9GAST|nr:relaxin receptor-like protein [Plakobranchus ocellatus]